jgi:hypothetical protein
MICVLNHDGTVYATFEIEENGLYEIYDMDYDDTAFAEFAHFWGSAITKLH